LRSSSSSPEPSTTAVAESEEMARRREATAGTREARTAETDAVVVGRKHACLAAAEKRAEATTRPWTREALLGAARPATLRLRAERRAMPARLVG
jgi:hypothetical protein